MAKRSSAEVSEFLWRAAENAQRNLTPEEAKLWKHLKPLGFLSQYWVFGTTKNGGRFPYRPDFFHPQSNLVVEVDGRQHEKRQKGRDRRRTSRLAFAEGIRVIRFSNSRVMREVEAVVAEIQSALLR